MAGSSGRRPSRLREGGRVGEVRELSFPFSTEGGAAAVDGLVLSVGDAPSFLFFAEGDGLVSQGRASGDSSISRNKTKLKHLLVHRSIVHPLLGELEA